MPDDRLDQSAVSAFLQTETLGRHVLFFPCVGSTNVEARRVETDGAVVVADMQTAGRGRMTRAWHSPAGKNLYFSVVLRHDLPTRDVPQLALLAAVALHQAFSALLPQERFWLKWPNDVWSDEGKKLSGILCEASTCGEETSVVIGVGINVNERTEERPVELRETAGSLCELAVAPLNRAEVLACFLNRLEPLLNAWRAADYSLSCVMDYWRKNDLLIGRRICLNMNGERQTGVMRGILADGRMVLETAAGRICVHAGDTHLVRTEKQ